MTGPDSTDPGAQRAFPEVAPNPYVGPRPFELGETLYGREDEITELSYRWNAERILLLYSPSGAGKSSLVQAGLLPKIWKSFDVWGPTRVNLEVEGGDNRYVQSALQGLEEGVPERLWRPPEELAGQTLLKYFETRPRRRSAPRNVALVFDQFEEILTVDPLAVEAKREFFDQLGELLHNPRIWALFVLREDYLAPLDPYALQVPTHLKNRFRIDLLGLEGAREAIVNPAREGGREFPAADQLIADLAKVKVQLPDGSFRGERGRHVEPVQLQVVCRRLWAAIPEDDLSIDAEDLARFGDVTEALASYYSDSLARIAAGDDVRERALRDWMGEALIQGDTRGQVKKGVDSSAGLENPLVERLLDTHLVRAEKRAGATWYELAHDRLIEPIQGDNAVWRAEHLSEVQRRAALWESQGRPPGLLLAGAELEAAERWAAGSVVTTELELLFLDASRQARAIAERDRRQAAWIRRLAVAASLVSVLALGAGGLAARKWLEAQENEARAVEQQKKAEAESQRAEREKQEADQARRTAEAESLRAERERQEADLAREKAESESRRAEREMRQADLARREAEHESLRAERERQEADQARREEQAQREKAQKQEQIAEAARDEAARNAATSARLRRLAEARALAVRTTSLTEEGDRELAALLAVQAYRLHLAAGGEAEHPETYDALRLTRGRLGGHRADVLATYDGAVRAVAVAAGGRAVAAFVDDAEVRLATLEGPEAGGPLELPGGIRALATSSAGHLAASGADGSIRLWNLGEPGSEPGFLAPPGGAVVQALAFRPDGSELAAGGADGQVRLLRPDGGDPEELAARGGEKGVSSLSWDGAGGALAAGSGREVLLWAVARAAEGPRVLDAGAGVHSVALSHDGGWLAAGMAGGKIALWNLARPDAGPRELLGHTARVAGLAFHPERPLLASASFDGTLRLWDAERGDQAPRVLRDHRGWVYSAVFLPHGEQLVSGGGDGTVRLWITSSELLAEEICRLVSRNLTPEEWRDHLPGLDEEITCPERGPS